MKVTFSEWKSYPGLSFVTMYYHYSHKQNCKQITKSTSIEDFQQRSQLKWMTHKTSRENSSIIMSMLNTTFKERFGRQLLSIVEREITISGHEKVLFRKKFFSGKGSINFNRHEYRLFNQCRFFPYKLTADYHLVYHPGYMVSFFHRKCFH